MEKKVFVRVKIMAAIISLLVTALLCGCAKEKGQDDPNLGLYTAKYGSMDGIELGVGDVFGEGFTIELKKKNKCEVFVDGDKASGKWSLEEDKFSFSAGGIECEGTLKDGVILLNDVMDTGITLTLVNENYKGAEAERADADSADEEKTDNGPSSIKVGSDGDNTEVSDDMFLSPEDRKWSGTWYGFISFKECTGAFADQMDCFYPVYMVVEFTVEDGGVFTIYDEDEKFADADFLMINDAITAVNGTAFDQPMNVDNYTFLSAPNVENRIVMYDTIYGDAGTLDYMITLKPWGVRWEESEGLIYFDDVIAPYYKALDANEEPKFGWVNPVYLKGSGTADGSTPSLPSSMKKDSMEEDGTKEDSSEGEIISNAKVTGKSYTWGNITVNVPDGMTATNGGIADRNDENSLWLQNGSSYILVSLCDKDKAQSDVSGTKSANGGEDTSVTINGVKWVGTYYEYSGSPCWHIYGEVDGNCFTAMGYNYSLDSEELQTVLATLSHS